MVLQRGPRAELERPKGVRCAVMTTKRSAVEAWLRGRVVITSMRRTELRGVMGAWAPGTFPEQRES